MNNSKMALIYDFDHTLSPKEMQEFHYIGKLGYENANDFWNKCGILSKANNMDGILSYMLLMVQENPDVTREELVQEGKYITLFPGVETWFRRINEYGQKHHVDVEHYIISSGIKEIIEGTSIAKEFKKIYACSYTYGTDGRVIWPSRVVNYTTKTQYIYRINKGVLDETNDFDLNRKTPNDEKYIPFENFVYFGDGMTDVPSMKTVLEQGGQTVAVYENLEKKNMAQELLNDARASFMVEADYSEGSRVESLIMATIDSIEAKANINRFK